MGSCNAKYKNIENRIESNHGVEENPLEIDTEISIQSKQAEDELKHRLIAGVAQVYATQPFDTVKVKLQTFPNTYKCMWQCFKITYGKYGIYRGLYPGVVPAVATNVVENTVLFGVYSKCQSLVADYRNIQDIQNLSLLENSCAGSLLAVVTTLVLCPCEVLKCKLQAIQEVKRYIDKGSSTGVVTPYELTKRIYLNDGITGFYRGLGSTFLRDVPGFFVYFSSYEIARDYLVRDLESKDNIETWRTMLAATMAAVIQSITTFPLDVMKSRIQIENLKGSFRKISKDILRKDGYLAFYSGILPSIFRTIPSTGALYLVYENLKKTKESPADSIKITAETEDSSSRD
ncbi:mitochondrial ornithine transporter 1-like [Musca autumnalis]|uniref:mitochondrial ornithine transporter 1-like n=1 Tax=Musca autumnalis TaxID=221902 RepID=UPI003CF4D80A